MAGNDKKLYKQLSHQEGGQGNLKALSPPQSFVGSPLTGCGSLGSPLSGLPAVFIRTASCSSAHGLGVETGGSQFCDTISGKTLFYLKSTMTASFQPDYDFTDAKSDEFSREPSVKWVVEAVRGNLSAAAGEMFVNFEAKLWAAIDEEIQLSECDIYR